MTGALAVVLAAGRGTRMKSELPKVLFPVLGRPMIHWVLDALQAAGCQRSIVVVGYRADDVKQELSGRTGVSFAVQTEQLGTGHAVQMCRDQLESHSGTVMVVAGDSPLIQSTSVQRLLAEFSAGAWSCLLVRLKKTIRLDWGALCGTQLGSLSELLSKKMRLLHNFKSAKLT